jgi:hypothetical protein
VPLSAGFLEMNRNSERRAEESVGGEDGIVKVVGPFETSASEDWPALDSFRSGFCLGAGVCDAVGTSEGESEYWSRRSRKGLQKYSA